MKVIKIVFICLAVFLVSLGIGFASINYYLSSSPVDSEEIVDSNTDSNTNTNNTQPRESNKN